MGFIDAVVGRAFRNDKAGRVVVFSGDRRNRGYLVRSPADELKIKSFLKMFYFAHFLVVVLGSLVAYSMATFIINLDEMGRPYQHLLRSVAIYLAIYAAVEGVPYFFLWQSYKKGFPTFVSARDQIELTSRPGDQGRVFIALGLMTIAVGAMVAILWLVRSK